MRQCQGYEESRFLTNSPSLERLECLEHLAAVYLDGDLTRAFLVDHEVISSIKSTHV